MGKGETKIIAVCGQAGSFSEVAGNEYAAQAGGDYELRHCSSGTEVVEALHADADIGVIPVENSIAGKVNEAKAIPENAKRLQEVTIPVRHQLLARPGTPLESIQRVVSHEQALAQCAGFLKKELPGAERIPYVDTAQAAKDLAAGGLTSTDAVIASEGAAREYGLETLREHVQDDPENRTRFLVFALSDR